jgi:hypothetical protein
MSFSKQPARQYVAAVPFHNDLFSYTVTKNASTNVTTGVLAAPIAGAYASTCPAGRLLRESGNKLYPGVHAGISTYMVGVIDSITFLAGYIDPNSPVFAVSNNSLPAFYANGVDPGPGGLADEGQPVYTNGSIVAAGDATIGGNEAVSGTIAANGQIRCVGSTGARLPIESTLTTYAIDVSKGQFYFMSTVTGGTYNTTLTCSNFTFGDRLFIQMAATGTVTFTTGFQSASTISKGNTLISFICDGFNMIEQCRAVW